MCRAPLQGLNFVGCELKIQKKNEFLFRVIIRKVIRLIAQGITYYPVLSLGSINCYFALESCSQDVGTIRTHLLTTKKFPRELTTNCLETLLLPPFGEWRHFTTFLLHFTTCLLPVTILFTYFYICLLKITTTHLDVPFRTVSKGSPGALVGFPGSPGVRSQKVRES